MSLHSAGGRFGAGGRDRTMSRARIRAYFRSRGKYVISFAGFGELGYQDPGIVERSIKEVLAPWPPGNVLVNSGTLLRQDGEDGIALVYSLAKELGIETSGIHPGVALEFADTHRVSPLCDQAFFVEDRSWGGFLDGEESLSPTLGLILEVSDELVVIGGGKHAADELAAFARHGKRVRYFPAEMNHRVTREWCRRGGADITDFRGAAHQVWRALAEPERR